MVKLLDNSVFDAALAEFATATRMTVCSAPPANFAGIAAVALADVVLTAGDGNGDYTIGEGDTSGRKVTTAQQADLPIDVTGEADHIAWDDGAVLLGVTECTPQSLTSGGTVTVPAIDAEIADPV